MICSNTYNDDILMQTPYFSFGKNLVKVFNLYHYCTLYLLDMLHTWITETHCMPFTLSVVWPGKQIIFCLFGTRPNKSNIMKMKRKNDYSNWNYNYNVCPYNCNLIHSMQPKFSYSQSPMIEYMRLLNNFLKSSVRWRYSVTHCDVTHEPNACVSLT